MKNANVIIEAMIMIIARSVTNVVCGNSGVICSKMLPSLVVSESWISPTCNTKSSMPIGCFVHHKKDRTGQQVFILAPYSQYAE